MTPEVGIRPSEMLQAASFLVAIRSLLTQIEWTAQAHRHIGGGKRFSVFLRMHHGSHVVSAPRESCLGSVDSAGQQELCALPGTYADSVVVASLTGVRRCDRKFLIHYSFR